MRMASVRISPSPRSIKPVGAIVTTHNSPSSGWLPVGRGELAAIEFDLNREHPA